MATSQSSSQQQSGSQINMHWNNLEFYTLILKLRYLALIFYPIKQFLLTNLEMIYYFTLAIPVGYEGR
ncbi:unnamed protein product [Ceratitis capitata]|uniref:(Mediterranean fruit fly) hypothetical protein n=1 Tax=Ceratitis capitata TaxID=7213 RepID=A0A811V3Q6_CERCA|nr:unnamed protein product [Ceratitis capitata]